MTQDKGASGKPDRATAADAVEPVPVSSKAGIPSAAYIRWLIAECERGEYGKISACLVDAGVATDGLGEAFGRYLDAGAWMDAAIALLPRGAVWRKFTDRCFTVYGASPYNAAAQERFDGFGDCDPLTLTAAFLKMRFAKELAALAKLERDTDGSPKGPDRNGLDGEAATAGAEGIAQRRSHD